MQHICQKKFYTHCILVICFVLFSIAAKTQNTENLIVKTFSMGNWSNLPVVYSNQIKGGIHQVENISDGLTDNLLLDLDEIPTERLQKGMLVNVLNSDGNGNKATFQYIGNGSTNTYPNDWIQVHLLYTWTSGEYYTKGCIATQNNNFYICNTTHTAGTNFDTVETAYWDKIATHKDINTLQDSDQDTKVEVEQSVDEDKVRFTTSGSERMIIDNSGKIGIGTSTPTARAEIEGNGETVLKLKQNGSWSGTQWGLYVEGYSYLNGFRVNAEDGVRALHKVNTGGQLGFSTQGNDPITFTQSQSTERMRIASGGNVGIGTNTPSAKLDVNGQIKLRGGNPGANKILQSNASGLGSWISLSGDATLNGNTLTIGNDKITTDKIGTAGASDANKVLTTTGTGDPQWEDKSNFVSSTLTDGQILVGNGSDVATGVAPTGDVSISNAGLTTIGADAVNSAKIADGQVMTADIANLNVTEGKLAASAVSNTKIANDAVTSAKIGTAGASDANKVLTTTGTGDPQWEDKSNFVSSTLTDGQILVGNGTNVATAVAPTGDISISNAGLTTIGADAVNSGKIADGQVKTADIANLNVSEEKLAAGAVSTAKITDNAVTSAKIGTAGASDANKVLTTTGTGDPQWEDKSNLGDNLGNHTATQNIKLSGNYLSNDGGNEGIFVATDGKVGIGTNTPTSPFHTVSSRTDIATFSSTSSTSRVKINGASNTGFGLSIGGATKWSNAIYQASGTGTNSDYVIYNDQNSINSFFIDGNTNNMGIGTNSPDQKLDVNGQIKIRGGAPGVNKILQSNANGVGSWVALAGDASLSGGILTISNNKITTAKIADNAVTPAKIGTAGVDDANKVLTTTGTGNPQWEDKSNFVSSTLTDGQILVGNGTNIATAVAPTGDISISNAGLTTIGADAVNSGKIADGQVKTADIANLNVTEGKLAASAVTNGKIADNAITTAKIGTAGAGDANKVLTTSATGDPQWEAKSALADNLGNHTAAQNIKLSGNYLSNDGGNEGVFVSTTGNVGIGNSSPNSSLDINSNTSSKRVINIRRTDNLNESGIAFQNSGSAYEWSLYNTSDVGSTFNIAGGNAQTNIDDLTSHFTILNAGNIGIGTTAPSAKLDVNGQIKIQGGAPGANKILTSDANGLASWVAPSFASSTLTSGQILVGNGSGVATGVAPTGDVSISNTGLTTIGTAAVNSGKIADGQVKTADIANLNVTEGKLAASAVTNGKIADNAITTAKIGTAGAGDANKVLTTSATGDPQWEAKSALADNLGNHTATQNIKLSGNYLSNDGGNEGIFVATDGKVGIGTNTPERELHLNDGVFRMDRTSNTASFFFHRKQADGTSLKTFLFGMDASGVNNGNFFIADNGTNIGGSSTKRLVIANDGNVGIGVTTPEAKLDVNGQIKIRGGVPGVNKILQSNANGVGSWVALAGDASLNGGTLTIGNSKITTTKIADNAVTSAKIGTAGAGDADKVLTTSGTGNPQWEAKSNFVSSTLTEGQILVGNGSDVATSVAPTGDVSISNTGLTTIGTAAVNSGKIADGQVKTADIANLNVTEGKLAASAVTNGKIADNAITTAKIGTAGAGDANKVLITSATGDPQWEDKSALGDNLGNHTATQNIKLSGNYLSNDGGNEGIFVATDGKIGMGTNAPGYQLDLSSANEEVFKAVSTKSGDSYIKIFNLLAPNLANSETVQFSFGRSLTTGDVAEFAFEKGADSRIKIGTYSNADILSLYHSGKSVFTGNVGLGTNTPLAKLHAGTTISDYATLDFSTTGALITANSGDQDDAESNVLTLMRDGTGSVVYAGAARFDMSQWEANGTNASTKLDIKLANSSTADLNSVLTMQSNGNVGVGTTTPGAKLEVSGQVKITGGTPGANKILTSDANGLASWVAPSFASNTLTSGQILVGDGTNVATGLTPSGDVTISNTGVTTIGANKITSGNITDGEVKTADIANLNVTEGKLASNAVTNGKIADNAVTTAKIGTAGAGDANKVLTTSATGDPQWEDKSALGDNLGNHTATQNIKLSGNYLSNDGGNEGIFVATDGKVGIGTNAPHSLVQITGNTAGGGSGTGSILYLKQNTAWTGANQWALYVDGYTNLGGYRINGNDGQRGLFLDKTTGQLGFATKGDLPITFTQSNTAERMRIEPGGNVGIGTTNPDTKLDINGQIKIRGGSPGVNKVLTSDANGLATWQNAQGDNLGNHTATQNIQLGGNYLSNDGGNEGIFVTTDGKVGIGTNSPLEALSVSGNVETNGNYFFANPGIFDFASLPTPSSSVMGIKGTNHSRLRITSGSSDTFDDSQGASIDLHGNQATSNSGRLDLIAGSAANAGNAITFWTNNGIAQSSKMVINADGNVGIGTNSPGTKLEIAGQVKITGGTPGANKVLTSDANGLASWQNAQGDNLGNHTASQNIKLSGNYLSNDGGNEGVFVSTSGNVGIGNSTPNSPLDVNSISSSKRVINIRRTDNLNESGIAFQNSGSAYEWSLYNTANTGSAFHIAGGNAEVNVDDLTSHLTILNGGNLGIGTTSPTAKLEVAGQVKITGGTPGANKILTSDASGLASWVAPSFASNMLTNGQVLMGNASDVATGVTPSGDVTISNTGVTTIGSNKITSGNITDGEVKTTDIANLNVTEGKLASNAVTNGKISDNAVTTAKIGTAGASDANKVLTTDGSGDPQWEAKSALGDNLGNHTATQDISLGTHKIKGSGATKPFELSEAYIRFAENLNTDAQVRSYSNLILWANDDNGGAEHMIFKVGGTGTGTERMRLTSAGNLGIGTTSVNDKLVVRNGTGEIRFGGSNGRTLSAYENGSTLSNFDFHAAQTYFNSDFLIAPNKKISTSNGSTDNLYLTTSNSSKAIYIDRKVGIGTNAPSTQLHVNAASNPIRVQGLQSANDNEIVTVDANGVFHKKAANVSGISTKTADYTATANDETLLADATTANIIITLPSATGNTGLKITIKRIDTSSNTLTISGNTTTIDGQANVTMNVAWQAFTFQCDGSNWFIIARY